MCGEGRLRKDNIFWGCTSDLFGQNRLDNRLSILKGISYLNLQDPIGLHLLKNRKCLCPGKPNRSVRLDRMPRPNYDVLQQGLPMNVVPHGFETKGTMSIVSLRPRYPTMHFSAFRISKSDECLIVKDWTKFVMEECKKRSPRLRDMFICMLQLDEGGDTTGIS